MNGLPRDGHNGAPAPSPAGAALDRAGPAAPPRRNGELAFDEPWQGRLFGITMALDQRGLLPFELFRQRLIAEIGRWEAGHIDAAGRADGDGYRYWDRWAAALGQLLGELGLVDPGAVQQRALELVARPAGHDHGRDRGHRHHHDG